MTLNKLQENLTKKGYTSEEVDVWTAGYVYALNHQPDLKPLVAENEALKEQIDTTKFSISKENVEFLLGQLMTCTSNYSHAEWVSKTELYTIAEALGFRFVWNDEKDEYEAIHTAVHGGNDE